MTKTDTVINTIRNNFPKGTQFYTGDLYYLVSQIISISKGTFSGTVDRLKNQGILNHSTRRSKAGYRWQLI